MSPDTIKNTFFAQNSSLVYEFIGFVPYNLMNTYGLYTGTKLIQYIQSLFTQHGYDPSITFAELHTKTNKTLVITGTSISEMDTFYFNYHTMPDMKVIDAIRISIGIPLYFTSVSYTINNVKHLFVDGGMLNNFPIYYFDIVDNTNKYIFTCTELLRQKQLTQQHNEHDYSNTIGIMFLDSGDVSDVTHFYQGLNVINNIYDYTIALLNTLLVKIEEDNFRNPQTGMKDTFFNRVICIPIPSTINALNFDLTEEQKEQLITLGTESATDFFNNIEPSPSLFPSPSPNSLVTM
jgi:NTE family protein